MKKQCEMKAKLNETTLAGNPAEDWAGQSLLPAGFHGRVKTWGEGAAPQSPNVPYSTLLSLQSFPGLTPC